MPFPVSFVLCMPLKRTEKRSLTTVPDGNHVPETTVWLGISAKRFPNVKGADILYPQQKSIRKDEFVMLGRNLKKNFLEIKDIGKEYGTNAVKMAKEFTRLPWKKLPVIGWVYFIVITLIFIVLISIFAPYIGVN